MNEARREVILKCWQNVKLYNKNSDIQKLISMMAVASGLPIIQVCEFVLEVEGESEEVRASLARLKKFYGVD